MQSQVQVFKIRASKLKSYSSETTPSFMTDFAELMDHVAEWWQWVTEMDGMSLPDRPPEG